MKNAQKKWRTGLAALIIFTAVISSCRKVPGHDVTPSGGTGTTGTTGTTTGTFTFRVNGGAVQTWTLPTYYMGLGTTPTTGTNAFSNVPNTLITGGPADFNLALTTAVSVCFAATTPGTYPASAFGTFIKTPGVSLTGAGGTVMITVTDENITITSTSLGTVKGSAKGTFAGNMLDMNTFAPVPVSGTFDVQIQ
ncbi:hypothetical protein BDD43_3479 [Mucilaginibacter gracilis]|uniref:Lipoprotein n=1 Tax=Mucilaginibacter gracilis TaxID=423350 RepID=A0A495J2S4_9SPHI|nr:hypothetical protein [Mucilaginibacter gracilis]RKR83275.1 hypothetical protein BDD43_3479 [Mucilaginibacter gracilis]